MMTGPASFGLFTFLLFYYLLADALASGSDQRTKTFAVHLVLSLMLCESDSLPSLCRCLILEFRPCPAFPPPSTPLSQLRPARSAYTFRIYSRCHASADATLRVHIKYFPSTAPRILEDPADTSNKGHSRPWPRLLKRVHFHRHRQVSQCGIACAQHRQSTMQSFAPRSRVSAAVRGCARVAQAQQMRNFVGDAAARPRFLGEAPRGKAGLRPQRPRLQQRPQQHQRRSYAAKHPKSFTPPTREELAELRSSVQEFARAYLSLVDI